MTAKTKTSSSKTKKAKMPFEFILEILDDLSPRTNPMFGCHAIYVEEKIMLILRKKKDYPNDNGVWLATTQEHHESLLEDFPNMRSITVFGPGPTGWQVLPEDAADFEESVYKVCEFIKKNDPRIGKIPKSKKVKRKKVKRKRRS